MDEPAHVPTANPEPRDGITCYKKRDERETVEAQWRPAFESLITTDASTPLLCSVSIRWVHMREIWDMTECY